MALFDKLEYILRNFTWILLYHCKAFFLLNPSKKNVNYIDRLKLFKMERLELRIINSDLFLIFKLTHNLYILIFLEF